ncbi:MAG: phage holin family protein [Deltaproteobacteria bacterium]|nr:phage holin family protein [Deltaproteobacteria bacterium]
MHLVWNLLLLSLAVFAVSKFLPGIRCKNFGTAVAVAVVYSIINFFIGWFLVLISLPAIVLTLGLFIFVINALLLYITDKMIEDYEIVNFGTTIIAALFITIAHSLLKWIF